ncbi:MAG: hypothetical protein KAX05_14990 [Bacteroidales bacterium]|nr:hypothetical protein [Bacteroidales bacterium]
MGKCFPYYLLIGAFLLIKCSDDQQIQPPDHFVIPNDKLAFYKIEKPMFYCSEIFIDSVTQLGERVIGYDQIIRYDTSNFTFEITKSAADTIKNINFRYRNYCMPIVIISNGEIIFGFYLYHFLCSSIPYWLYTFPSNNQYLTIYPPEWTVKPLDPDPRKDSRIIQVLLNDNKLK